MTVYAFHVVTPGSHRDRTTLNEDCHDRLFRGQHGFQIPRLVFLALYAIGIQMLLDIAFAMGQRDRNQRKPHIRRGPESVAGKDAKPATIGWHRGGNCDFHRKVCDEPALPLTLP